MALNNYTELKKSIIDWSHREDADLIIPDFIQMAESEMFANDEEILYSSDFEKSVTLTTTAQEIDLPTDFILARNLKLKSGGATYETQFLAPQELQNIASNGLPTTYTIVGNKIRFNRVPDAEYDVQFDYLGELTPLSETDPVNEILTKHPQIYLFGALWALKQWAEEPEDSQIYYARFIKAIRGANKKYKKGRYGIAPQMRIKGSTP